MRNLQESSQESWRRMLTAQERVRQEVAELLHGTVQSRLLVAAHRLRDHAATVESGHPDIAKQVVGIADLLDDLNGDEISVIVRRLHPPIIRVSLLTALRSLAGDLQRRSNVAVDIRVRDSALHDLIHGGLPENVRLALYRLVEQALIDQEKIAPGRTITVTVGTPSKSVVTVSIQSDEQGPALGGRQQTRKPCWLGDRWSAADGTVEYRSLRGAGVSVVASLAAE